MLLRILLVFVVVNTTTLFVRAQVIDEVRLGYHMDKIKAKQLSVAASADGKLLAFAYDNGMVKIFEVESNKFKAAFQTTFTDFHDLKISTDGKVIITAGKEVAVYNWRNGETLKSFKLPGRAARMDFNAKHNIYVVGQMGGSLTSFDITNLAVINSTKLGGFMVNALALDPEGKQVALSLYSMKGKYPLKIVDLQTGAVVNELEKQRYQTLSFDSNGNLLAYGWGDAGDFWFQILSGAEFSAGKSFTVPMQKFGYVESAFSGDKAIFTTASLTLDVYDFEQKKLVYTSMADAGLLKIVGNYAYPKIIKLTPTKFLFSYGNYNISRIYDATTNNVSAYLYTDGGDDYCLVSRDGRIDGNDALNNVYWTSRKSKSITTLDQTFEKGFTPRLLTLVLAEDQTVRKDLDVEKVIAAVPQLSIKAINGDAFNGKPVTATQKEAEMTLALTENKDEVSEIKVYHNTKLIKTIPADGSETFSLKVTLNNAYGEDNFISAVASGKTGVESEKAKAVVKYKGVSDQKPTMYLLTIGINEYKNTKYNLNYAQADADGFSKSISSSSSSLFLNVVQYNVRNSDAVKKNIISALDEIKSKALEQDLLIVYYAGHGIVSEDPEGDSDFYLALHDVTQLYGRPELLKTSAISATEIKALTQVINAQKQVFLLDACQSGGALKSAARRGVEEERAIAQLARNTGTFWITASGSTQFATEVEKLGHGIFTYALLKGVAGEADVNKDKKLSVRELSVYIEDTVPALTEQYKGAAQYPASYSFGNDFPIVLFN